MIWLGVEDLPDDLIAIPSEKKKVFAPLPTTHVRADPTSS